MSRLVALLLTVTALAACGGGGDAPPPAAEAAPAPAGSDLTAFQLEHGIGPVTERLALGPVDGPTAEKGAGLFETKCSACHKLDAKYVGPALGDVTTRRSPEFVVNMILNPQEMIERHPAVQQMLQETMSFMPNQGLTRAEAMAVLEYLRSRAVS